MHCSDLIHRSVFVAILLNLALPYFVAQYATPEEIKPPNGANSLSMKGQIIHMLVHHKQVPLSSSVVVAVIVFLSMYIAYGIRV